MTPATKPLFGALVLTLVCNVAQAQTEIESVRVHGNHTIPDDEVLRIAAVAPGDTLGDDLAEVIMGVTSRSRSPDKPRTMRDSSHQSTAESRTR